MFAPEKINAHCKRGVVRCKNLSMQQHFMFALALCNQVPFNSCMM
jgi:hypothetical protein